MRDAKWLTIPCLVILLAAGPAFADLSGLWLHVRVNEGDGGNQVRVNVPLGLVGSLLPMIDDDDLRHGRLHIGAELDGLDLRELLTALHDAPDADFVTVRGRDEAVRVAKEKGFLLVHVDEQRGNRERVRIRVPLSVVDAMVTGRGDELDVMAGLEALARHTGENLIEVDSDDESVRVWIDADESGGD